MKDLGYGKGYRYAHDEPDAYAAGERYLPEGLPDRRYYRPAPRGLELRIGEALERLRARAPEGGDKPGGSTVGAAKGSTPGGEGSAS
jgi:putative ATPase